MTVVPFPTEIKRQLSITTLRVLVLSFYLQPLHLVLAQQVPHFLIVNLQVGNTNQKPVEVKC